MFCGRFVVWVWCSVVLGGNLTVGAADALQGDHVFVFVFVCSRAQPTFIQVPKVRI